ncbi:MAG: phage tail tape measure protein, partial [Comamonas sp.]
MAFKPIQIIIGAKDEASKVIDGLSARIKTVGVAIAAYFGVNAFVGVVKGAADLEAAMSAVQAATGATKEEMVQLEAAASKAIEGTKFTSVDAAGALENLGKAGLDAGQSMQALPAVVKLAAAGNVDLARSADFVTKSVMGMGLSFDDALRVADVLAKGANATNTSVEGLGQALSYTAPIARTLGVSLEGTV